MERFDGLSRALGAIARSSEYDNGAHAFERSLQAAALAWGVAAVESGAESQIAAFGELMASCLRNARDDATQVGSLELIRALNTLADEFPAAWEQAAGPAGLARATRFGAHRRGDGLL
jgi:hypothetical protein